MRLATMLVLIVAQRPDRHPQPALAFTENGDRRIAFAKPADDLRGRQLQNATGSIR